MRSRVRGYLSRADTHRPLHWPVTAWAVTEGDRSVGRFSEARLQRPTVRIGWIAPRVIIGVAFIATVYVGAILLTDARFANTLGWDLSIYRDAAQRWLSGSWFYYPEQVAGPYELTNGHVLYPPPVLLLFVPFTVLPVILWWLVPLTVIVWRIVALRPSAWAWAGMAACLAYPPTVELTISGNPLLWVVAALALATRWPWVSVLVFAKPSLLPFAFYGVRYRSWWVALGACALISLAFLPMWSDWFTVLVNARGRLVTLGYSASNVPMMLIPIVAWIGRTKATASGRREGGQGETGARDGQLGCTPRGDR